ncbi:MAG: type II toxin-antitoxin system prevent-host-death family antitoxin [Terracidiphilus sp.]
MVANPSLPPEQEGSTAVPEPLPFGQNLLGITYIADDFYEDIPLEDFLGDEESNKLFLPEAAIDQLDQSGKSTDNQGIGDGLMASTQVNLYEAKTQLSSLVERAAKGEEIVIAKAGKPMAKLVALPTESIPLRKFGQNVLGITFHSDDWEKDIPLDYFQDEGKENPFGDEVVAVEPK